MQRLFCFGYGYVADALARSLLADGWTAAGTVREPERAGVLRAAGVDAVAFDGAGPLDEGALTGATHILHSIPPGEAGDPALVCCEGALAALTSLEWIGYLSATSVYGDTGGALVDETAPCRPTTDRGRRRAAAEQAWLAFGAANDVPVQVFRLAGIYGPGRSALDQLRRGQARRISKPGHLFSRIHRDDIVAVLRASIARPAAGAIYNVCDDEPAESADVLAFAAELLGMDAPPLVPFEEAALSEMARSFYRDDRRIDNARIKRELGVDLRYPDYRTGLRGILDAERGAPA